MKNKLLSLLAVASLLLAGQHSLAAETNSVQAELKVLVTKIQVKLKEGRTNESDLSDDLKGFDGLLAKHKNEKTDDVAQILFMKAILYLQVLHNTEKGIESIKQLKHDFPETKAGQSADKLIASIQKQGEGEKIQRSLVKGSKFPDFNEKDLAGKPLSIANHKGKIVLIDFWATWCGPCKVELPNVLETYRKHHGQGFEIIGISLDEERQDLETFIKARKMTWPQFFDGKVWENTLAVKYGVHSIPATYLLDGEGKIIGSDLRGEDLESAVAKALAKK